MNNLKEINIKNLTCSSFDDIVKIEDFDFDNILLDENNTKTVWFRTFHIKPWLVQNHCLLG